MYRKNTASQYIYFALVNSSTGAALTGATVTAYRALDDGVQAAATGTTTELANGHYRFNLSQADTNSDYGSFLFTATTAVLVEKTVVFTGANVTAVALGANTTTPTNLSAAQVRTELSTELARIDATITSRNAVAPDNAGIDELQSRILGTLAAGTHEAQSGDSFARIGANGAGLTSLATAAAIAALNNLSTSQIATELATYDAPTNTEMVAAFTEIKGATWATTDTLEAIRDRGDAAWLSANVASLALASQIPANFTSATFASAGVFATAALVNAPTGSGGTVNVLPAVGIVADRSPGATLNPVVGETISQSITLYATDGTTPINMSGKTLAIPFETRGGVDVAVVASAAITISGANNNVITFAYPAAVTASESVLVFSIKDASAPLTMYMQGLCSVTRAPQVDA